MEKLVEFLMNDILTNEQHDKLNETFMTQGEKAMTQLLQQYYAEYIISQQITEQLKTETHKPKILYTQAELYRARQTVEQLETIERETQELAYPLLLHIWKVSETVDELKEHYRREIDRLNYCTTDKDENGQDTNPYNIYDMRAVGEYAYKWNGVEVYKETILTLFRTLSQLLAYEQYNIERDPHTPQVVPLSACERGATMKLYSD